MTVSVSSACLRAMEAGRKTMLRQVAADGSLPCPLGERGARVPVRGSSLDIEIESTRLERLQEIRDDDLEAEGGLWRELASSSRSPREAFGQWWDSVHARPGTRWDDNPLVWVVTFRTIEK